MGVERKNGIEYYSNVEASEVEWIWYPYIPCGKITLLQGDPGEGKSTFILQIVSLLTRGKDMPDGYSVGEPITAIYQCSEDGASDTVKPRLLNAKADCNRVAFITESENLTLDDDRIEKAIRSTKARLLIIDPLQAYLGTDSDMKNAVKMRKMLGKLSDVAKRTKCAVVLVGHMNKAVGGKNLYRGLGSIDIVAIARSVLMIARDKSEPCKCYMFPVKSSLAPEGEVIGFEFDREQGFIWNGVCDIDIEELMNGSTALSGKKEMAANYLQMILNENDMASVEIFAKLSQMGIARRTVQEAKKALGIKAYKKEDAWYWHLD